MGGCVLELASVSLIPTLKAIILSAFTQGWFCMLNWIEFGTCYDQSFEPHIQKCHSVVYKNWGQSFWNKWSLSWITEIEGWIWFYSQLNITNHKPLHRCAFIFNDHCILSLVRKKFVSLHINDSSWNTAFIVQSILIVSQPSRKNGLKGELWSMMSKSMKKINYKAKKQFWTSYYTNGIECITSFAIAGTTRRGAHLFLCPTLSIAPQEIFIVEIVSRWHNGISNWMNELVDGWMKVFTLCMGRGKK